MLDKDGNLVKDVTLESEAEKKATNASSTEKQDDAAPVTVDTTADITINNKVSKLPKPEKDEEEEEQEQEEEEKDGKGKKNEEDNKKDNADDDKESVETEKDKTMAVVLDGGENKGQREEAFTRLREQLVKQQQQQQQLSTVRPTLPRHQPNSIKPQMQVPPSLRTAPRPSPVLPISYPPEDMRAVMNAKAEKDKTENK